MAVQEVDNAPEGMHSLVEDILEVEDMDIEVVQMVQQGLAVVHELHTASVVVHRFESIVHFLQDGHLGQQQELERWVRRPQKQEQRQLAS